MDNGELGHRLAKQLWPRLILTESGGREDKHGTDGWLNGCRVQIKYDSTIANTGNLYIEHYEKTEGKAEQLWRPSPMNAHKYIFVTEYPEQIVRGYLIGINQIAQLSINRQLRQIRPTSIGILIPLMIIEPEEIQQHQEELVYEGIPF